MTEARAVWTVEDLRPYVAHVLEVFGAQRVIWGSDWPVVDLAGGYGAWLVASESLLSHLGQQDRNDIFGLNARRFYGLD